MHHRTVEEVMTREVVTVAPESGFREIAELLTEYRISAVPVVDAEDRPVGVVSEGDLIRAQAAQEDASGLLPPPIDRPATSTAVTAEDLMGKPPVCVGPEESVVVAARLMDRHHVKRLPVVGEGGRLVGVVSRHDLLRVFLRDDHAIHREIVEEVLDQVVGVSPAAVGVEVVQGRVVLSGRLGPPYLVPIVLRLCAAVDGVVSVTDRIERVAEQSPGESTGQASRREGS
ncbi:CBS domain-containing protein [Kitasatospora sp. RB6PN24]|uniref:CBS domain-containing protein n=1 Tax=Kitasatospora humi TaxID=2893891 RepID=UPI001E51169F|nr:CBS domain-containing protein [Kitasatospora humi]MCC9306100.1 CBS domain-containing protein [Kitasatospora humi]